MSCLALGHHWLIVVDEVLKECGLALGERRLTSHQELRQIFERVHGLRRILHGLFEEE